MSSRNNLREIRAGYGEGVLVEQSAIRLLESLGHRRAGAGNNAADRQGRLTVRSASGSDVTMDAKLIPHQSRLPKRGAYGTAHSSRSAAAVSGNPQRSRNPMNVSAAVGGFFQDASISSTRARTRPGFRSIK